jgi:hypothetical protein
VIHPVSKRQWEDVNWNDHGKHSCVNTELGTFVDCCISAWFPWMTDPLGAQAVRQLGILSRCRGEDVLGKFSRYISNFNCFLL